MSVIDSKIVGRFKERLDEADKRAAETMAGGMLPNFSEYQRQAGLRAGYAAARTLIDESLEEIMKE